MFLGFACLCSSSYVLSFKKNGVSPGRNPIISHSFVSKCFSSPGGLTMVQQEALERFRAQLEAKAPSFYDSFQPAFTDTIKMF